MDAPCPLRTAAPGVRGEKPRFPSLGLKLGPPRGLVGAESKEILAPRLGVDVRGCPFEGPDGNGTSRKGVWFCELVIGFLDNWRTFDCGEVSDACGELVREAELESEVSCGFVMAELDCLFSLGDSSQGEHNGSPSGDLV